MTPRGLLGSGGGTTTTTIAMNNMGRLFEGVLPGGQTTFTFSTPLSTGISWNRTPSYGPGAVGQPVLVGLSLNPTTVISGTSAQGTVTLSGPAPAGGALILLSSASPNAATPAAVTVPAGSTSATVSALTAANISAAYGLRLTAPLRLNPPDTLTITRAEYTISQKQLRLEATSTNSAATLTVFDSSTGAFIGTMTFSGGGKFQIQMIWPTTPRSVTIKSTKGGSVTGAVTPHN